MRRSLMEVKGFSVNAIDDSLGPVKDFLIDDGNWVVRYVVVDTHQKSQLASETYISALSLRKPDWLCEILPAKISRRRIDQSPKVVPHGLITRQDEAELLDYYGYEHYWNASSLWGSQDHAMNMVEINQTPTVAYKPIEEHQLHEANEIIGFDIFTADGKIGTINDFIFNVENWAVDFLAVTIDAQNEPIKSVLVAPTSIQTINVKNKSITLDLTAEVMQCNPEYIAAQFTAYPSRRVLAFSIAQENNTIAKTLSW